MKKLIFPAFFLSIFAYQIAYSKPNYFSITVNGVQLQAETAITTAEKIRGLSGRKSLAENQAMLFIYPQEDYLSFWMKDMNFPIDMIWLNKNCEVVYIAAKAAPCLPNTQCIIYAPKMPAQYVLETVAGFTEKHNIKVGSEIKLKSCSES